MNTPSSMETVTTGRVKIDSQMSQILVSSLVGGKALIECPPDWRLLWLLRGPSPQPAGQSSLFLLSAESSSLYAAHQTTEPNRADPGDPNRRGGLSKGGGGPRVAAAKLAFRRNDRVVKCAPLR